MKKSKPEQDLDDLRMSLRQLANGYLLMQDTSLRLAGSEINKLVAESFHSSGRGRLSPSRFKNEDGDEADYRDPPEDTDGIVRGEEGSYGCD